MESFGTYLKSHREKKGIRLEEIASITKIHLHSLQLLETSQWSQLPPEPFIRGFIIAYAKYIGLDVKETLTRYQEEVGPKATPAMGVPPTGEPAPAGESGAHGSAMSPQPAQTPTDIIYKVQGVSPRSFIIGVSAAAVLAVIIVLISIGKHSSPRRAETASIGTELKPNSLAPKIDDGKKPSETRIVASPGSKAAPIAAAKNKGPVEYKAGPKSDTKADAAKLPGPPADAKHELVVEGKERTWIKVVVDNDAPLEFYLSEGQKASYKAKEKIKLVLGNAEGSKVYHNGELVPGTHYQGTVRFYIFPKGSRFPQDAPSKRAPTSDSVESDSEG